MKIAAEESVLQLVNGASLVQLQTFLSSPQRENLTKIISIPGIYRIMECERDIARFIPILAWVERRASTVLRGLTVEDDLETAGASQAGAAEHDNDWKTVSTSRNASITQC